MSLEKEKKKKRKKMKYRTKNKMEHYLRQLAITTFSISDSQYIPKLHYDPNYQSYMIYVIYDFILAFKGKFEKKKIENNLYLR